MSRYLIPPPGSQRAGWEAAYGWLHDYLAARDLAAMDAAFATVFVSNPDSGETVKGHTIVLAELGLAPFRGTIVRNAATFAGAWSKERREAHLLARMAFTQALWQRANAAGLTLYRGIASATRLAGSRSQSIISTTFARAVAEGHFNSPGACAAALYRGALPRDRLVMTFLETPAMNHPYQEAEAVLTGPRWPV